MKKILNKQDDDFVSGMYEIKKKNKKGFNKNIENLHFL